MRPRRNNRGANQRELNRSQTDHGPLSDGATAKEADLSLLDVSLSKSPWERMLANDDALRFANSLQAAMEKRHAKPERTDPPPR